MARRMCESGVCARTLPSKLAPPTGFGLSLASSAKRLMAPWSSTIERKTPRWRRRVVSLAKKPSTALSHEQEVRREVEDEARVALQPRVWSRTGPFSGAGPVGSDRGLGSATSRRPRGPRHAPADRCRARRCRAAWRRTASVESLKERTRCGCSLCARQMRCTEETLIPVALAIAAAVQWVAWCGGSVAVSAITRSMIVCSKGGIRDGRVLSRRSPSTPSVMNRSCQRQTLGFDLPLRRMISAVPRPSAVARMIFARQACFCGLFRSATSSGPPIRIKSSPP